MGISTHRPWHPVDLDLGDEEEPSWTRISYADERESLPSGEPSTRWVFERVVALDPIG